MSHNSWPVRINGEPGFVFWSGEHRSIYLGKPCSFSVHFDALSGGKKIRVTQTWWDDSASYARIMEESISHLWLSVKM